jgi:hypothetical protein
MPAMKATGVRARGCCQEDRKDAMRSPEINQAMLAMTAAGEYVKSNDGAGK